MTESNLKQSLLLNGTLKSEEIWNPYIFENLCLQVMLNSRPWAEEGLSSKFRDVLSSRLFEAIEPSTLA